MKRMYLTRLWSRRNWTWVHHVVPFARGGQATVDNIELRCRGHNQYEAILDFGPRDLPIIRETESGWLGATRSEPSWISQRDESGRERWDFQS